MLEVNRPSWFDAGCPGAFDVLCWHLLALAGVAPTRATRPLWLLAVGGTFDLLAGVCGRLRALRALISMTRPGLRLDVDKQRITPPNLFGA